MQCLDQGHVDSKCLGGCNSMPASSPGPWFLAACQGTFKSYLGTTASAEPLHMVVEVVYWMDNDRLIWTAGMKAFPPHHYHHLIT